MIKQILGSKDTLHSRTVETENDSIHDSSEEPDPLTKDGNTFNTSHLKSL